jgi:hypothetical protein
MVHPCVELMWGVVIQILMKSDGIVEDYVGADVIDSISWVQVFFEVDFFVFDGSPKSLTEDVVSPSSFPVHADLYVILCEEIDKVMTGELHTLIGIEDLRCSIVTNGFFESRNTGGCVESD